MKDGNVTTEKIVIHRCANGYLLRETPDSRLSGRMWVYATIKELRDGFTKLIEELLEHPNDAPVD